VAGGPVPQPQDPDLDPLLEFFEEHGKSPEPPERAKDPPADDLSVRVDRAERQLDRALIDITAVKSDLATLVSAVEEIKKRPSRPPEKPATVVAMPPRKVTRARTVATVLVVMLIGAAAWGLASAVSDAGPDLPPIESESSSIIDLPPIVEAISPAAANGSGPSPSSEPSRATSRDGQASLVRSAVRREPAARPPAPRVVNFVGTLTIDAEPAGEVFVNRRSAGRTPLRLDNLPAGSHLIWIEREGYRRWTRVVAVVADRVSRISASLVPLSR
jgi:hypothetical protein